MVVSARALLVAFYANVVLAAVGHLGVLALQGLVMFADVDINGELAGFAASAGLEVLCGVTAFVLYHCRQHVLNGQNANLHRQGYVQVDGGVGVGGYGSN